MEAREAEPVSKRLEASSAAMGSSLFELILAMQKQQMTWMESQQKNDRMSGCTCNRPCSEN